MGTAGPDPQELLANFIPIWLRSRFGSGTYNVTIDP